MDVVLTNKALVGKTVKKLAKLEPWRTRFSGVFLRKLRRAGQAMPFTPARKLNAATC